MSKHFGLHWRWVSQSSSWCTNAGVLRLAGIEVRRILLQGCECADCCACVDCLMDGEGDRLERRLVVPMVLGFDGGDSRTVDLRGDTAGGAMGAAAAEVVVGVVDDAAEDADSFSLIIDSESSADTDGNLFVANVVFFLQKNSIDIKLEIGTLYGRYCKQH